jgi:hypothetical protein
MRTLLFRLAGTLRRKSADRRLDAEIQFHLEMLAREFQAQGMSKEEADLAARRQFGGVEQARARDVTVRLALGASRWRLLQERLVESLLLAIVAGAISTFLAQWIVKVLPHVLPLGGRAQSLVVTFDRRQVVFTFLVAAGTGLYLWLTSALQVTRRSWLPPLAGTGGTSGSSRRPLLLRRGLVVVQVALSLALLCTSTLLSRSLYNLMALDTGFRPEGLTTVAFE